jgi:hypothetical protein
MLGLIAKTCPILKIFLWKWLGLTVQREYEIPLPQRAENNT